MTQPPEDAQRSADGNYWWDGSEWQPVAAPGADAGGGAAGGQQQPPQVVLVGEAGFNPPFPEVGKQIEYYWSEQNVGGPTPDTYHARVKFTDPEGNVIDEDLVECSKLETNGQASRTKMLSAPQKATIGYSIELWVDVDHNTNFSEGLNYAYHNVDASDPT